MFWYYAATDPGGPFLISGNYAWADPQLFPLPSHRPALWIYATEIGNGHTYVGESAPSNTVYIQPLG